MTLRNLFGLLLVSIFLFTLPSCGKDKEPEIETTPQTLLFYFVGTDLDRYNHLRNNRAAIKAALNYNIQGKSRVVIFHQNGQKTRERRRHSGG